MGRNSLVLVRRKGQLDNFGYSRRVPGLRTMRHLFSQETYPLDTGYSTNSVRLDVSTINRGLTKEQYSYITFRAAVERRQHCPILGWRPSQLTRFVIRMHSERRHRYGCLDDGQGSPQEVLELFARFYARVSERPHVIRPRVTRFYDAIETFPVDFKDDDSTH